MVVPDQRTYTFAEAADLVATDETFVERALGDGLVPTVAPGLLDAAGLRALRILYSESG